MGYNYIKAVIAGVACALAGFAGFYLPQFLGVKNGMEYAISFALFGPALAMANQKHLAFWWVLAAAIVSAGAMAGAIGGVFAAGSLMNVFGENLHENRLFGQFLFGACLGAVFAALASIAYILPSGRFKARIIFSSILFGAAAGGVMMAFFQKDDQVLNLGQEQIALSMAALQGIVGFNMSRVHLG